MTITVQKQNDSIQPMNNYWNANNLLTTLIILWWLCPLRGFFGFKWSDWCSLQKGSRYLSMLQKETTKHGQLVQYPIFQNTLSDENNYFLKQKMKQKSLQGKNENDEARLLSHTDQSCPVALKHSLEFLCLRLFLLKRWDNIMKICKGKYNFH